MALEKSKSLRTTSLKCNLRPKYYFYLDVACSGNCGGIFFNLYNDEKVLISI